MTLPRRQQKMPKRGLHIQIDAPKGSKSGGVWLSITDHQALNAMEVAADSKPREGAPEYVVSFWGGERLDGYWQVSGTAARTIHRMLERKRRDRV